MLSRLISMQKMADSLIAHQVGKGEFWCYIGIWILGSIILIGEMVNGIDYTYEPSYLKSIDLIILILAIALPPCIAYLINKQGDNKDFWYRYFSISFPIAIISTVLLIALYIILSMFGLIDTEVMSYTDLVIELVLSILILYWTQKYMRYISSAN